MANTITKEQIEEKGFWVCNWDLETTSLNGSFGHILCGTIKRIGKKPKTYRIDQFPLYKDTPWDDSQLVVALKEELEKNHVAVAYNGYRFDVPFLNTRLAIAGVKPINRVVKHVDLFLVAKKRLRLSSASLDTLLTTLGTKNKKTPLLPELWRRAVGGDKKALNKIVEHNIADVVSLEEAFLDLLEFWDIQFRLLK